MALNIISDEVNEIAQARLTAWVEWGEAKWGKADPDDVEFYAEMVCNGLRAETELNITLHKDEEDNYLFYIEGLAK